MRRYNKDNGSIFSLEFVISTSTALVNGLSCKNERDDNERMMIP